CNTSDSEVAYCSKELKFSGLISVNAKDDIYQVGMRHHLGRHPSPKKEPIGLRSDGRVNGPSVRQPPIILVINSTQNLAPSA
ncbi:hypothetical protein HAX54_051925, partial [Datura stramonium]|nr:hypothetical protein [Datura stramonium]